MKKEVRKLTVTGKGKTYYVTIPKWMIEELKWRKGQKVEVNIKGQKIEIRDWQGR